MSSWRGTFTITLFPFPLHSFQLVQQLTNIMIFEKLQFSLYQLLLKIRFNLFLVVLMILAWTFMSVSLRIKYSNQSNEYFQQCMARYFKQNPAEEGNFMPMDTLLKIVAVQEGFQSACAITTNRNTTTPSTVPMKGLQLFRDISLEYLPQEVKDKHNINQIIIVMNSKNVTTRIISDYFGVFEILLDKVVQAMQEHDIASVYVRDFTDRPEVFEVRNRNIKSYAKRAISKLLNVFVAIWRVFFCSIFSGLLATTFMILVIRGMIMIGEIVYRVTGVNLLLRYFPFLNDYLAGLRQGRRTYIVKYVVIAYFLISCVIFFGLLYFINSLILSSLIGLYYTSGNQIGLLQMVVIQFLSIIMLRSRTSIKHCPQFILRTYMICQFLAAMNSYRLSLFYVQLGFQINLIYLLIMFITVESAIYKSNQLDRPHKEHPRALYFPNYNIAWHSTIPPLWTYFVPPHDRSFFNQNQLSYVNAQYERLYAILMGLPYNVQEREGLQRQQNIQDPAEVDMVQGLI